VVHGELRSNIKNLFTTEVTEATERLVFKKKKKKVNA